MSDVQNSTVIGYERELADGEIVSFSVTRPSVKDAIRSFEVLRKEYGVNKIDGKINAEEKEDKAKKKAAKKKEDK